MLGRRMAPRDEFLAIRAVSAYLMGAWALPDRLV